MDNQNQNLSELYAELSKQIDVEQIYLQHICNNDRTVQHLFIIVSNHCDLTTNELEPMISFIINERVDITFKVFHAHQIKEGMRKGNLYFFKLCQRQNLVFSKSANFSIFPDCTQLVDVIEKAKKQYSEEIKKSETYFDGASFFITKEDYGQSAFMLHQTIELTYRAVELLTLGTSKRTHSIRVHQLHIADFIPELSTIFSNSTPLEKTLFKLVEDAYLGMRYKSNYAISKENLEVIFERAKIVLSTASKVFNDLIDYFQNEHPNVHVMENKHFEQINPLNAIKDLIIHELETDHIFCLLERGEMVTSKSYLYFEEGNSHQHYILLVVSKHNQENVSTLKSRLSDLGKKLSVSVTLLIHSTSAIRDLIMKKNRFFCTMLKKAKVLFSSQSIPLPHEKHQIECESFSFDDQVLYTTSFWMAKCGRANGLEAGALASLDICEHEVAVTLIAQGIEQALLGCIYVVLGYKPQNHSLSHLLDICSLFTNTFDNILPRKNIDDLRLFKILADSTINTRYRGAFVIPPTDVEILLRKGNCVLKQVQKIGKKEFRAFGLNYPDDDSPVECLQSLTEA